MGSPGTSNTCNVGWRNNTNSFHIAWDILANQWEETKLNEWGMDVWQTEVSLEDFFEEATEEKKPTQAEWYNKFVEYIKENYNNAYNEACKSADK